MRGPTFGVADGLNGRCGLLHPKRFPPVPPVPRGPTRELLVESCNGGCCWVIETPTRARFLPRCGCDSWWSSWLRSFWRSRRPAATTIRLLSPPARQQPRLQRPNRNLNQNVTDTRTRVPSRRRERRVDARCRQDACSGASGAWRPISVAMSTWIRPRKRPDPERASRLRAVQLEEDVDDVDG